MDSIPPDVTTYAEYHALLVRLGKSFCRKSPKCPECPVLGLCRYGSGVLVR
jgi:endonuclease-3 related protein